MLPAVTVISVQAGASYATDRREVGNSSPRQRKDGILDAAVSIKDERTIGGTRWRSQIVAAEQLDRYTSELTRGRIAASTGPVIMLSRDVWLHLAPGGAAVWLDGHRLYDEASAVVVA